MYSLYYSPFACSFAVHAALEKIGQPFDLIKVDIYKSEHLKPEFLSINPQAQVPVLQQGNACTTQASAILLLLSEQHPDAQVMPSINSEERAEALEMLFYLSNTIHPIFSRLFSPDRFSEASANEVKSSALIALKTKLTELNTRLSKQDYCASNTLYAPDYYLFAMLNWLRLYSISINDYPNLKAFIQRMKGHTEIQTALTKEMQSMAA